MKKHIKRKNKFKLFQKFSALIPRPSLTTGLEATFKMAEKQANVADRTAQKENTFISIKLSDTCSLIAMITVDN